MESVEDYAVGDPWSAIVLPDGALIVTPTSTDYGAASGL